MPPRIVSCGRVFHSTGYLVSGTVEEETQEATELNFFEPEVVLAACREKSKLVEETNPSTSSRETRVISSTTFSSDTRHTSLPSLAKDAKLSQGCERTPAGFIICRPCHLSMSQTLFPAYIYKLFFSTPTTAFFYR